MCLPRSALRAHHPELDTGACAMKPSWLHTRLWKRLRFLTGFCTALQSGSLFFNNKPFHILSDLYPSQQTPRHSPSEISNCLKAFPHFLCCKRRLLHRLSLTLSPSLHPVFPTHPLLSPSPTILITASNQSFLEGVLWRRLEILNDLPSLYPSHPFLGFRITPHSHSLYSSWTHICISFLFFFF